MIDLDKCANILVDMERGLAPYDTGNLMNDGISNVESIVFGTATYWINKGGKSGDAPYGIILNEAMAIRGNNNIHYHWHDNAFYVGCLAIAAELGGELF